MCVDPQRILAQQIKLLELKRNVVYVKSFQNLVLGVQSNSLIVFE